MATKEFPLSLVVRAVDKASPILRGITAKINADTGPLRGLGKDFGQLGEALNVDGFMKVGGAIQNVGATAFAVAARFAGLALGAGLAFGAIIKGAMDAGDSLAEHAERVGLSIDSYASLQFAAAQADVPQEMFADSLDKLNKQMGDMRTGKGGKFLHFLNEISPTFAKQVQGAKTTEEAFFLLTDAMEKIPDEQRRAKLATEAFGKSSAQMGVFMHQGKKAIIEQEAEFIRLFGSQEKSARAAGELDNATRKTETAFLGLRMAAAGALFPALVKVSDAVTKFLVKNRDGIAAWAEKTGAAITSWVDGGGFDRLVSFLGDVAAGAGRVVDFLGPMGIAAVGAGILLAPLIVSVGSLGVALVGVLPVLVAFAPLIPVVLAVAGGVAGLVTAGVMLYKAWDGIEERFRGVGDALRWAVLDGWNAVRPVIAAMSMIPGLGVGARGALGVGDFAAGQVSRAIEASTGQSVAAITAREARANAPFNPAGPTGVHLARVAVDFNNVPRGVRVSQDPNGSQPVDLSVGPSMVTQ